MKRSQPMWTLFRKVLRFAKAVLSLVLLVLEILRRFKDF